MLTEIQVRNARPRVTAYKMTDSHGLFLFIAPTGLKSWRWKYRFDGKEKKLTFGRYPEMSLREARIARDAADQLRRDGRDPSHAKADAQIAQRAERVGTLEAVAREWHEDMSTVWRDNHAGEVMRSLKKNVFPRIGARPIGQIEAPAVLEILKAMEEKSPDQAHRMRQRLDAIFARAIGMGLATTNPAAMVGKALKPMKARRHPAVRSIEDARDVLLTFESEKANAVIKLAHRMLAVTAARSEAVRFAEWGELERLTKPELAQWRIPSEHMKGQREQREDEHFEFIVPLPQQAIDVIEAVRSVNGNKPLVFGGIRDPRMPMSDSTMSAVLRKTHWQGKHRPHGWRSTFSTIMNEWADESGRPGDRAIIDLMLAHKPQGVEAIYNRAAYMTRRRELATIWADMLLDGLPPASSLIEAQ